MRIGLKYLTPALAAGAAALAIAAAPSAMADTTDAPMFPPDNTALISPSNGNGQINDSPPEQFGQQYPYGDRVYRT
jgi:hypothetical protein